MVKYSLVTKNIFTDEVKVLIEKKPLIELDRYIYNSFSSLDEIKRHFNVSDESELKIKYTYQSGPKFLDLILKNNSNYSFLSIIRNTKDSYINTDIDQFNIFVNSFINSFTLDEIKYLRDNGYINKKMYFDLVDYKNCITGEKYEIYRDIKYSLKRYLEFRKLYIGVNKYRNRTFIENNQNDVEIISRGISTDDELLNNLYNNGDMDSVYSNFDLDELLLIDGYEQLPIDGLKNIVKNR